MTSQVPVGVFRKTILPLSETFIQAQAQAMVRFRPHYFGLAPAAKSLVDPAASTLLSGKISPLTRARGLFFSATGIAPRYLKSVRDLDLTLIHAHFAPDGAVAQHLTSALKIPLIVTLHGYDVTTHDRDLKRSLAGRIYLSQRPRLWKKTALFLCVSNFIRQQALAAGFPEHKLRVQYIGVDRTIFQPFPQSGEKLVLFVGRLVPKKGCIHLLRAMQAVRPQEPTARLVVIGDGPLRQSLQRSAVELNVRCEFLGAQPATAVLEWMRRARLLCMPSITAPDGDSEGLGMVMLEAQAIGRPIVGFRTGGIPEAIHEGVTGLLATTGDERELAAHLMRMLSEEALWNSASAAAMDWVKERFDLANRTRELEEIYSGILASASQS
jgi:glycosyltransferase involved in cell wall biosynthesis